MQINVSFPGGKRVDASFGGLTVATDQPPEAGGEGSAVAPFDLFLASLATCAGYYALAFCRERKIPTAGLGVTMITERPAGARLIDKIVIRVAPPAGLPEKYRAALLKSVDHCTVKAHLEKPPRFETVLEV